MALADFLRRRVELPAHAKAALAERLGFTTVALERQAIPQSKPWRPVVGPSNDLDRVLALPWREKPALRPLEWLKKPSGACCCVELGRTCARELLPIQAWALSEAQAGGLLGAIGVGHGKELICELLPLVITNCKTAILLIPPDMREAFRLDWEFYGQHWLQPNLVGGKSFVPGLPRLKVIAYSELSHEKFTAALRGWGPDLIIANEAHALCGLGSVRTRRLLTYCAERKDCRFVALSGTLTKRSLVDYGHLSALALGQGSPLPIDADALAEWAQAIDPETPGRPPALMGALSRLCKPGETVRDAFKRRRAGTPGVVDTSEASIPNALNLFLREPPPVPLAVTAAIASVRSTASRPDGEEFIDQWQVAKCLRELAAGFYYRWIYPRGEAPELIEEWFSARQAWNRELRDLLTRPIPHLDSPALAMKAAIRYAKGAAGSPEKPVWPSRTFREWAAIRKKVRPETEAVWLSDWLARDAAEWAAGHTGIVWYTNGALGRKISKLSGLRRYGGGPKASAEILAERGTKSIIVSMKAHARGKNLQAFADNLITQAPPDAADWEQLLGRTHRIGQKADAVNAWICLHTTELREAFARAEKLAEYVEQTTPNKQKLRLATYGFERNLRLANASK